MGGAVGFFIFFCILFLGLIFFAIYFLFKILQFVIQSVNLYKSMVTRQDMMIALLQDIRSGKITNNNEISNINKITHKCNKCGELSAEFSKYCDNCGANLQ